MNCRTEDAAGGREGGAGIRVIVTGGAGFIGTLLARRLLAGPVAAGGADPADVAELILADLVVPAPDVAADPRVRALTGDLAAVLRGLGGADVIFHLAAVPSGGAEADFDLGMRTNVDGTRAVLEHARGQQDPPVLVFSSTLAVFGSDPAYGPAGAVGDDTLPRPQSSYGVQKFIGEQLVADYTRKGFVRGRSVRLMTVAVRPGRPNAAASSFLSGIVREPLAGLRALCPVPADTPVALSSPGRTIEGILRAAAVSDAAWGSRTAMNLPALTTTPRDMAAAMDRVAGHAASGLIDWGDDPVVGAIVRSWPARVDTPRAHALGLRADESFDDIVREYLRSPLSDTCSGGGCAASTAGAIPTARTPSTRRRAAATCTSPRRRRRCATPPGGSVPCSTSAPAAATWSARAARSRATGWQGHGKAATAGAATAPSQRRRRRTAPGGRGTPVPRDWRLSLHA